MAKAIAPDTTAMSVTEAAAAIVALINSRSQSPWPQEIEAIIAKVATASMPRTVDALPLSADHLNYRQIIAEIARFDEEGCPRESEATLEALSEKGMALERKIWATPAKTLADVLLRGEIALFNENGVMEHLDNPEAYYDDRSIAQLMGAVVDVLGGNNAS
jgi:hypothetical protein